MHRRWTLLMICLAAAVAGCATAPVPSRGAGDGPADDSEFEAAHCNAPIRALIPSTNHATIACADASLRPDVQYCACTLVLQTEAAQSDPAPWYVQRGAALLRLGETERAIRDLDEALASRPELAAAYLHRGDAYRSQKDYGRALVDYNQALELEPKLAPALSARCWTRAVWHKAFDKALADCDAALLLQPGDAVTLSSRALVHYQLAQYDLAIADCDASLAADPAAPAACHYIRGLAQRQRGADDAARADLAAARALDGDIERRYREFGVRPEQP